jgi:hypothetical protein
VRWLTLAVLVLLVAGCTINDPTETTFSARFLNDLGYDATIGMCSNETTCRGGLHFNDPVKQGGSVSENISSDGYVQPFRIATARGHVVGCLFVVATHDKRDLVIRLTRLTPYAARRVVRVVRVA